MMSLSSCRAVGGLPLVFTTGKAAPQLKINEYNTIQCLLQKATQHDEMKWKASLNNCDRGPELQNSN